MPWDRYVGPWQWSVYMNIAGGTAMSQIGAYTVPPDKWLWISALHVQVNRASAATTTVLVAVNWRINGAAFRQDVFNIVPVNAVEVRQQNLNSFVLAPSTVLSVWAQSYDVGGTNGVNAFGVGYTFTP